jgi:plastocyanin
MRSHRTTLLAVALTALVALTACGKNDRLKPTAKATARVVPTVAGTVNPAPSPSATASAAESESAAPSASASATGGGGGNNVRATVANKFEPATLTVKKGTKVTWTADPGTFHSAQSGTPPTIDQAGPIHHAIGFTTFSVTFTKPGTYKYFCEPHASLGMTGEIVVT